MTNATPVDTIELAAAPSITLGGKEFKIPAIVPRQNRIITPLTFDLMDVFVRAIGAASNGTMLGFTLTTEQYDTLLTICHTALWRAYPEVTREQFDDLPIKTIELLGALVVIARQAGCMPEQVKVAGPLEQPDPKGPDAPPTG